MKLVISREVMSKSSFQVEFYSCQIENNTVYENKIKQKESHFKVNSIQSSQEKYKPQKNLFTEIFKNQLDVKIETDKK